MTSGANPFRGGSTVTTSGRRPSLSSLAAMSAASPQKKLRVFDVIAEGVLLGVPDGGGHDLRAMTRLAAFARHRVMVPIPQ